jgi:hypothetical protein
MCFGGNKAMSKGSVSSSKSSYKPSAPAPTTKKRSAGRGSGANKTPTQFVKGAIAQRSTDLQMGLSTLFMNKGDQAAKLSEMGYSPKAIDSYQARTAASAARAAQQSTRTEYGYKDRDGNITNPALSPQALAAQQQAASPRGLLTGSGATDSADNLASAENERRKAEIARLKAQQLRRRLEGGRRGRSSLITGSRGGGGYA